MPTSKTIANALQQHPSPLFLAYQPIKRLDGLSLPPDTFEALLRFQRGTVAIAAGEFLPGINDALLKRRIDAWVMGEVAQRMRGDRFRYAINLSEASCHHEFIQIEIATIFDGLHIGDRLVIEVSEDTLLNGVASKVLPMLGQFTVIWLDDFGAAQANFGMLLEMEQYLKGIKIDGKIISNMRSSALARQAVEVLFDFCKGQDLDCTCEWVEDEETLEMIRAIAYQFPGLRVWIQGWVLG